ncbi:PEBP [Pyrrhoderma noxium]|uniref:PEBP n=1 Tax=Pyrrhoderma noxium TaxID=2282107 RepID=A0A286UDF3_9AGAM|nr:PEBP [Pyrrhoderma noxium]
MPLLDPLSNVSASLRKHGLIPDVIPEDFIPSTLFSVSWPQAGVEAMLGNTLTKVETSSEPSVEITPLDSTDEGTYTLAMLDPDAPSHQDPKFGPFRHWIIQGLRPPTTSEIIAAASKEKELADSAIEPLSASTTKPAITPYRPPGPGAGTGMHRYVFLLFKEPGSGYSIPGDAAEHGTELEQRRKWDAMDFAKRYGLTLVGANYFLLFSD